MNFRVNSKSSETAVSVLELLENEAIFRFSVAPFRFGMNFPGDSRGSENGDFCTRVN